MSNAISATSLVTNNTDAHNVPNSIGITDHSIIPTITTQVTITKTMTTKTDTIVQIAATHTKENKRRRTPGTEVQQIDQRAHSETTNTNNGTDQKIQPRIGDDNVLAATTIIQTKEEPQRTATNHGQNIQMTDSIPTRTGAKSKE
jgi:hypothetical protein